MNGIPEASLRQMLFVRRAVCAYNMCPYVCVRARSGCVRVLAFDRVIYERVLYKRVVKLILSQLFKMIQSHLNFFLTRFLNFLQHVFPLFLGKNYFSNLTRNTWVLLLPSAFY